MLIGILSLLSLLFIGNTPPSTVFPVCDVIPADYPVAETTYKSVVEYYATLETASDYFEEAPAEKVTPILESYGKQDYDLIHTHSQNPVVFAIQLAYAEHRPLTLSPDMIWLLILQGFAEHVDLNSEALRDYFVDHEGKKVLYIERDDYVRGDEDFPWPEVFTSFKDQISKHTDSSLVDMATKGFSTTGSKEIAAFEVALMDAMSEYFLYAMGITCGIPEITLEGTPKDWETLEARTAELGKFELDWWTESLAPILEEFTAAAKGNVNTAFWQDIYELRSGGTMCGATPYITGWILKFFPYYLDSPNSWVINPKAVDSLYSAINSADQLYDNPKVQRQLEKDVQTERGFRKQRELNLKLTPLPGHFGLSAIELSDLPMGISSADLLLDYHGNKLAYKLQAGFVGVKQDKKTLALSPEINWLVIDTGKSPSEEDSALFEDWKEQQQKVVKD